MTYRKFYEEIYEIIKAVKPYGIFNQYIPMHNTIIALIDEIDQAQGKKHDNFRNRYLPKTLSLPEAVAYATVTTSKRFINENNKYEKELKELPKGSLIGYWTTVKKVIFYTKDRRSLGQFVLPKKGLIIFQGEEIEVIEKKSIRQKRSDSKYHDLIEVGKIEVEGEILSKKIWRREG